MDEGIWFCLIFVLLIVLFILWRIPIGRRLKREEDNFITENIADNSILIFYGNELNIGKWNFYSKMFSQEYINQQDTIPAIKSYYGGFTIALPPDDYECYSIFEFNYGNGLPRGATGYTERIHANVSLSKGVIYRYRLKDSDVIPKKIPYKILFEKEVSTTSGYKRTVIFDEVVNDER